MRRHCKADGVYPRAKFMSPSLSTRCISRPVQEGAVLTARKSGITARHGTALPQPSRLAFLCKTHGFSLGRCQSFALVALERPPMGSRRNCLARIPLGRMVRDEVE